MGARSSGGPRGLDGARGAAGGAELLEPRGRLVDAIRLIEHSYGRLALLDRLVVQLLGADASLERVLSAVRDDAVRAAKASVERHAQFGGR